jgi:hypothetical protein
MRRKDGRNRRLPAINKFFPILPIFPISLLFLTPVPSHLSLLPSLYYPHKFLKLTSYNHKCGTSRANLLTAIPSQVALCKEAQPC